MGAPGAVVVRKGGARGVLVGGAVAVFNAHGECPACCDDDGGGPGAMRFRLTDCEGVAEDLIADESAAPYVGSIVKVQGRDECWTVTEDDPGDPGAEIEIAQVYETCQECLDDEPIGECPDEYDVHVDFTPPASGCWSMTLTNLINGDWHVVRPPPIPQGGSDPLESEYGSENNPGAPPGVVVYARVLRSFNPGTGDYRWGVQVGTPQFWVVAYGIPDSDKSKGSELPCPEPGTYPITATQGCPGGSGTITIG